MHDRVVEVASGDYRSGVRDRGGGKKIMSDVTSNLV